jgi:hypothetical protein
VFHPLFPNTEEYSIQTGQEAISKAVLGMSNSGEKKGWKHSLSAPYWKQSLSAAAKLWEKPQILEEHK